MRLFFRVLIVLLLLTASSQAARFRGNMVDFEVATGGKGRPSIRRIFADADAFATRRGMVRRREEDLDRVYAAMAKPPPYTDHIYTLRLDPAKKQRWDDLKLLVRHDKRFPNIDFFLEGIPGTPSREFMQRFKEDFRREFARRYGARNIVDNREYHEGWQPPKPSASSAPAAER